MASSKADVDVQANINAYWNERGQSYDSAPGHGLRSDEEYQAWLSAVGGLLPAAPADVLDVGAGTGFLTLMAGALGHRATGIDLADGMLAVARQKAADSGTAADFMLGDAMAPDFPDGSFDVVMSRHVIWTLRDPEVAFRNWFRLLRPGGSVVAIDSLWFQSDDRDTASEDAEQPADQSEEAGKESWQTLWQQYYSDETVAGLPNMSLTSLDPLLDQIRAAGFAPVEVRTLEDVESVEAIERLEPRYVIIAERPR